jgi:serine/threonine protein kinase
MHQSAPEFASAGAQPPASAAAVTPGLWATSTFRWLSPSLEAVGTGTGGVRRIELPPEIIPFYVSPSHAHMIMPLCAATLEHLPHADRAVAARLFASLERALLYLHALGLGHSDVKPSNVLLTTDGSFVLADLGSLERFGQPTETTPGLVPFDLKPKDGKYRASARLDFAMLAMTLFLCTSLDRHASNTPGSGVADPPLATIMAALQQRLPPAVYSALSAHLSPTVASTAAASSASLTASLLS